MRILVPVEHLGPVGGAQRTMLELAEAMTKRGHEIHVAYRVADTFTARWEAVAQDLVHIPMRLSRRHPLQSLFGPFWSAWRLRRLEVDVVLCSSLSDLLLSCLFGRVTRTPVVVWIQEPVATGLLRCLHGLILRRVDTIAFVSEFLRGAYQRAGLARPGGSVIYVGLDLDYYRPPSDLERRKALDRLPIDGSRPVILYLGRLDATKGIETLLACASMLRSLDITVLIAGAPSVFQRHGDSYARLLAEDPPPGVQFIGRWDEARDLLWAADLLVMPSIWEEPLGRVQLEAMACGVAAVATEVGGIPETFPGPLARFLFPPGDVQALTALVTELLGPSLGDPELAVARTRSVQQFDIERSTSEMEALLFEVESRTTHRS